MRDFIFYIKLHVFVKEQDMFWKIRVEIDFERLLKSRPPALISWEEIFWPYSKAK